MLAIENKLCFGRDLPCPVKFRLVFSIAFVLIVSWNCRNLTAQEASWPSVGVAAKIESVILPGTELEGRPLFDDAAMVVQVENTFVHGDSFRYDLRYQGFEPGEHDLSKWLVRKDGSSTDDLPPVMVTVRSLLPPGQKNPNTIETGGLPYVGGYKLFAIFITVIWVAVLLGLIFIGRTRKKKQVSEDVTVSLADLLKDRLQAAAANEMDSGQYAELERVLFSMWRRRLGLEEMPAAKAMQSVRSDENAGPLMRQLETWIHSPKRDPDLDLASLLQPYQNIPASELKSPGGGK